MLPGVAMVAVKPVTVSAPNMITIAAHKA